MAASGPRGLLSSLIQECEEAITGLVCVCVVNIRKPIRPFAGLAVRGLGSVQALS